MTPEAETKMWQRLVEVENEAKSLKKQQKLLVQWSKNKSSEISTLQHDVQVLEDARERQIKLNEKLHTHNDTPTPKPSWKFW